MIYSPEIKIKNSQQLLDFTEYNLRKIVKPSVWDVVLASAIVLQEELKLPFEVDDVVVYPPHEYAYEVRKIHDKRQSMPPQMGLFLDVYSRKLGRQRFQDTQLIQISCLMAAHEPYNDNIHIIEAETMAEATARLAIVLANNGIIK